MVDPLFICAIGTAGLGAWELLVGRPVFGMPRWTLSGRGMRLIGAYSLALSLVVIALAVTQRGGLAFVTYAIGVLTLAATVVLVTNRKASG